MKINISNIDKKRLFFTSDPHYYHTNIIKYCNRPFNNAIEMNAHLINKWNKVVPKNGIVFMLGDFAMGANSKQLDDIMGQLNGEKHNIIGNHDRTVLKGYIGSLWKTKNDLVKITVTDNDLKKKYQPIVLCHYPMITWDGSHRGSWQLFGHVHGGLDGSDKLSPNQLDVGVDSHNFTPISYEEVKKIIIKQNLKK